MIDALALLLRWIREGLPTERISATVLPEWNSETSEGFRFSDGAWIVLSLRGGSSHPEAPILSASIAVRVWAGANQAYEARVLYLQVLDLIHGKNLVDFSADGFVISCQEEVHGQDLVDPDTGDASVLGFFNLKCRANN